MTCRVCVEEEGGRWIAHVSGLPGCFAWHPDREAALDAVPGAVDAYRSWCTRKGIKARVPSGPVEVCEIIRSWVSEEGNEVGAFFACDRPPLSARETPKYKHLLQASREDLLAALEDMDERMLTTRLDGQRWPIRGVLEHVAKAEWWYLDRLGLAFRAELMPRGAMEKLAIVRSHLLEALPALKAFDGITVLDGEIWSARKVLRRALWHERDHTAHVLELRARLA